MKLGPFWSTERVRRRDNGIEMPRTKMMGDSSEWVSCAFFLVLEFSLSQDVFVLLYVLCNSILTTNDMGLCLLLFFLIWCLLWKRCHIDTFCIDTMYRTNIAEVHCILLILLHFLQFVSNINFQITNKIVRNIMKFSWNLHFTSKV